MATQTLIMAESQVKAIVKEAVQETFLVLGVNVQDHNDVVEFQQDMHHVRTVRKRSEAIINKAWLHTVTVVVSAGLASIVMALFGHRVP